MIYAVSDLHGCYDKYIKLLERLKMTSDNSGVLSESPQ